MGEQCWTLDGNHQPAESHNIHLHVVQGNWIMERTDLRGNKTAGWAMQRAN